MPHDDGLAPDEYAEQMELRSLLKKLRLGDDFDPYRVIHVPHEDRTRDTDMVSYRMSKHMRREIDKLHGPGRRFQNRTEWHLHYDAIGLMIEARLSADEDAVRSLRNPYVAKLELENLLLDQQTVDQVIEIGRANIKNSDADLRAKVRIELQRVRRICEDKNDRKRLGLIDDILDSEP